MFIPAQTGPEGLAAMVTEGTRFVEITVVMVLDVTEAGFAQVAFDVIITVTSSPLFSVAEVNVVPPDPALVPFTCH